MRVTRMALVVCLGWAAVAAGQVPRDPFSDPPSQGGAFRSPGAGQGQAPPSSAASQTPAPYVTRQSDVEIPFSVRAGTTPDNQPSAVRIFVSWDRGTSWHFFAERKPEEGRFRFKPKQDGEYWFATQTIDRSGRPDNPEPNRPQLRLVVDTQRPQLLVQAQVRASGEVAVSWSGADATLNPATLKIEYQDASGGNWEAVTLPSAAETAAGQTLGQTTFAPVAASRSINLRAEIADAGGNMAYFSQRLSLTPPKPKAAGGLAFAPAPDPSATRWTTDEHRPSAAGEASGSDEDVRIPNVVDNPFVKSGRLASSPQPASPGHPSDTDDQWSPARRPEQAKEHPYRQSEPLPPPSASGPDLTPRDDPDSEYSSDEHPASPDRSTSFAPTDSPSEYQPDTDYRKQPSSEYSPSPEYQPSQQYEPSAGSPPPADYEPLPPQEEALRSSNEPEPGFAPIESEPSGPEIMPAPGPATPQLATPQFDREPVDAPLGQRPRLTNSRRFSLDYDVEAVGPEGVAEVELWGTIDSGSTWVKWGADPDRASPFDVEVNGEAIYGFRIVIVGKSGLATSSPQPGDAADIWVGIDSTRPTAHLTGAAYGQGEAAGKLDIRWDANDVNLGPRPITLAISDRPDGPFAPIAAGLPNTGQYFWEFDPRSPRQIYLRLEVRDEAGNIAIDQLTEPIKVEGLEPKGRIRGFNPAVESPRGAFRSPLFR